MNNQQISSLTLYDQDFYLWIETTAKLLREGKFTEVDWENLIEEIETMGRSEKRAIESNLIVVLMHLLKWKYQTQKQSNSWKSTIFEHQRRLKRELKDSPSLKPYLAEIFDECYQDARKQASLETELSPEIFPTKSPFSLEDTLNFDYWPD